MKKIKHWLIERILPIWARAELEKENARLQAQVADLRTQLRQKDAYIEGLSDGIRSQRRIIINTTEVRK